MTPQDTECSICLQKFVHPVKLPCGHIFCFLCIKGCALHRKRCPMCRGRFSSRFFDAPQLVPQAEALNIQSENSNDFVATSSIAATSDTSSLYRWFYEGNGGWWQYDERTSDELEDAFHKKMVSIDITVAGFIYTVDFLGMSQMRKDYSGRRRRIKRDLSTCEKKGIAGIKLTSLQNECASQNPTSARQLEADAPNFGLSEQSSRSTYGSNLGEPCEDLHTGELPSLFGNSLSISAPRRNPSVAFNQSSNSVSQLALDRTHPLIPSTTASAGSRQSIPNEAPDSSTRSPVPTSPSRCRPT